MSKKQTPTFMSSVAGIPCGILVTWYSPGTNYLITSASLEPNDPEEFDFEVLDRKGYPAQWLVNKMTDDDEERIFKEFKDETR